ncbi:MAG: ATP-binding protein, partial [Oscillospiraceae bacterium]
ALSGDNIAMEDLKRCSAELSNRKEEILSSENLQNGPLYSCTICNDTGYVNGKLCNCVIKKSKELSFQRLCSNMPLEESTFKSFQLSYYSKENDDSGYAPYTVMQKNLAICRSFSDKFPCFENLFLCGGTGLGKTHLSLAIANEVINKGFSVIYGSAQNLIKEVADETFSHKSNQTIDSLNNCDLLIIDDLGTEFSTNLSVSIIYNIINTRLLNKRSTIISTNLSLQEVQTIYSPRIASRVIGNYTMRMFIGSDIRQLKAQKAHGN